MIRSASVEKSWKRVAADNLQYFWIDTCCIDKSNVAELEMTINSMFRWYQRASKCYVYLSDVQIPVEVKDAQSCRETWEDAFRRSRWFTRGWTLPELIAPATVEFFSKSGKRLGSKISLEQEVHKITKIPIEALRGRRLSEFSIEGRMAWAANRKTTVEEDKVYCLLGIFGVFLPLIYGEGEDRASRRFIEEIKRQANAVARAAVDRTLEDNPERAKYLNKLANFVYNRYSRTGATAHLEEAIQATRAAIDLTLEDHPERAKYLNKLANFVYNRYSRTGATAHLEEAIQATRAAIDLTLEDHPKRAKYLNNLGNLFGGRYLRTGDIADLEEGIQVARAAVDTTPENHPDRAKYVNNLGNLFGGRYLKIGDIADLENAIQITRAAIDTTPENYRNRAKYLNNLGCLFGRRYSRTGGVADLEEAIQAMRAAVDTTPENHLDRAKYLNNLGVLFSRRYSRTGNIAELEEGIQVARAAVDMTPENHLDRAKYLANLRNLLGDRFLETTAIGEVEEEQGFVSSFKQTSTEVQKMDRVMADTSAAPKSSLSEFDSGHGSVSRPARSAEFSEPGIQGNDLQSQAVDTLDHTDVSKDYDIQSLASENDDIGSQVSTETMEAGLTGQALIGAFLADNSQFRALCDKVLPQIDTQRFAENVRRLLRSFYKNLLMEAKSEGERAIARLLRRRRTRLRISERLIVQIESEQDLAEKDTRHDLGIAVEDKLSLENWLASVSDTPTNLPEDHFDIHSSSDDSAELESQDEFPFTSELKRFLEESESFKSLLRDFMLWLLPADLRQVLLSIPRSHIWVSQEQDISLMNLAKAWVEDNTKVKWNWWPLEARKRTLCDHESRLFWRCVC